MKIALFNTKQQCSIEQLSAELRGKGADVLIFGKEFHGSEDLPSDTDLLLALGGDGTFLRALDLVRHRKIPVAGINFGRLGFLTAAKASDGDGWMDRLLSGKYSVEHRTLLKVAGNLPGEIYPYALNEVTFRGMNTSVLSIDVTVDGLKLPAYWADGLIISTPTGSTAYNLSAGGPIVMPGSEIFILTPLAPHNLNVRPLVIPSTSSIEVTVSSRKGSAVVSLDNRIASVPIGERFLISAGEYPLEYVSLSGSNFINALETKLFWGLDKRNSYDVQ